MVCPKCKGEETKVSTEIDDAGDIEIIVCANEDCGWILHRELIVRRPDGTQHRRPQRIDPESQPDLGGGPMEVTEPLPTMEEMMQKAIRFRQETVGRQVNEHARRILEECVQPEVLLEGKHRALLDQEVAGEIVNGVHEELKNLGYKTKKVPEPGKGTWIELSWPTKQRRNSRKKKAKDAPLKKQMEDPEITFPNQTSQSRSPKKAKTAPKPSAKEPSAEKQPKGESSAARQAAAKKKRVEAMKARSESPK